ncbi:HAD family hydrolase [Actinocorallia longicatena]|uniref:Cof-type HAD-IIB family hydrolase n=1 Tax=Actinocorallia longicatena TaxID=111803 RepID=A0ABP6Q9K5_9ACTN
MPKLIASDLDGTLLGADGTVSPRTAAALRTARASGAGFVMVTGRPARWIHQIADQVDHAGYAICANGALIYDLSTEQVVSSSCIPPRTLGEVVARLRDAFPDLRFAVEYGQGFVFEARFNLGSWDAKALQGRPVDDAELIATPAVKLLALHPTADPTELADRAAKEVGDLVTVTHSSFRALLEISALGVTKATALAGYCDARGLTAADVVAFGDMPNDLPMLAWAGRPYAMANAHPAVLAAVADHTGANTEDGVAQVLERLFPG